MRFSNLRLSVLMNRRNINRVELGSNMNVTRRGNDDLTHGIGFPVTAAMPDSQDFHRFIFDPIYNQVRCIGYNSLAGCRNMSRSSDVWVITQLGCRIPYALCDGLSCGWIISCNEVLGFNQIRERRACPADFQIFAPHRANALRTSSSVAKAPRSAAAIPNSTALRKRASSITSSQDASGGNSSAKAWTFC
jgi:hypothetical protein